MSSTTTKVDESKTKTTSGSAASTDPIAKKSTQIITGPIDPFANGDPFGDADSKPLEQIPKAQDKIHIRLQQRNGRKTITTVQGIPDKFDARKLLKAMKKEFACNGHVVHSADSDESGDDSPAPGKKDDHGKVLQFQGDQRESSKEFLIASNIVKRKDAKTRIVVHGY